MLKCQICKDVNKDVYEIKHGDKSVFMCSLEFNKWVDMLPVYGVDVGAHMYVYPEGCSQKLQGL